jgi:hypothetical protein
MRSCLFTTPESSSKCASPEGLPEITAEASPEISAAEDLPEITPEALPEISAAKGLPEISPEGLPEISAAEGLLEISAEGLLEISPEGLLEISPEGLPEISRGRKPPETRAIPEFAPEGRQRFLRAHCQPNLPPKGSRHFATKISSAPAGARPRWPSIPGADAARLISGKPSGLPRKGGE